MGEREGEEEEERERQDRRQEINGINQQFEV